MSSQRPQDLVFTLYGEYLRRRQGPVWVGSLIRLLAPFGISEGGVRTVLSRMARKGWLAVERRGRHAYYGLTPRGDRLLAEGEARIFHPSWSERWDGRWYLVAYSIPEQRRHLRDRLRIRLAWLGFGSLGNGLWISPHDVGDRVSEVARDMGVTELLECFRARHLGDGDHDGLVQRCWDLPALANRYRGFLDQWRPRLESWRDGAHVLSEADCFANRFNLIHEFREFPLEDPYLPRSLLPEGWPGPDAGSLFNDLHDLLEGPAERYVGDILGEHATPTPARSDHP